MKTTNKTRKAQLIRKYHTLCGKLNMSDADKRGMLSSNYGVSSSKDLYADELEDVCRELAKLANPKEAQLERARNRVFGAVGGWFDLIYGKIDRSSLIARYERIALVKATACRATEYGNFNQIPIERLNNVSHLFSQKQKDYKRGIEITDAKLADIAFQN